MIKGNVWTWNNFRGGLSDNPFLGQEGQFQEGLGVDVQSEPSGFKLTSDFSSLLVVASAPNVILDLADFGGSGIYTFCAAGEIYKDASTTPIYTDVTGSAIVAATAMKVSGTLYIYYFTAIGLIHRINTDGTGHTTKGSLIGSTTYPIVKYGGDIYFCDAYTLKKLEHTAETLTTEYDSLCLDEVFTGLTFFQDTFHIYSRVGDATNPRDGKQYIIGVGSDSPDYITFWNRLPILGACNIGATDYVVTGAGPNYSDLYTVSGTQRKLTRSNFEGMALGRKFNGKIVSWKDEAFLIGRNQETGGVTGNSVFRLGQYFPGLPQALTELYRGNTGWELYSIMASYSNIYIGRKGTSSTYTVSLINIDTPVTAAYRNNGYVISQIFDGGDKNTLKGLDEIDISYMCDSTNPYFPHGGTIALYGRINPGDSWTQIGSSYAKTDIGNIKITSNEIANAGLNSFYQIEFKVQIIQGSSSLSPLVTGVKVYYQTLQSS